MTEDGANPLRRPGALEPVLAVCGPSGAGKTTLLVDAVARLVARGLRVAVVKHDVHGITVDPAAKDSARLFAAGADVVLQGPGERLRRDHGGGDLAAELRALVRHHDLVLVEGHRGTPLPKVWLLDEAGCAPGDGVGAVLDVLPRDASRAARFAAFLDSWLDERWAARPVLAALLVGGRSRRMGRPKQLLSHGGRTLGEIAAAALGEVAEKVLLVGAGPRPDALAGLARLTDVEDVPGPLGGMLAALRWQPGAAWIVAACDLPLVTPEAVRWLLAERRPGRWAVLPRLDERGLEPLLALYEPQAHPLLEAVAAAGGRAPNRISRHPAVVTPSPPAELRPAWTNVNSPEDLARCQVRA